MLGEDKLIPILANRLEELGVVVERGIELTASAETKGGVDVTLENRAGQKQTLTVKWLAGCDGVHSLVREKAGIDFEGDDHSLHWHVLDAQIEGWPFKEGQGVVFFESYFSASTTPERSSGSVPFLLTLIRKVGPGCGISFAIIFHRRN